MIQIQRSFYKLDFPRERRQGPWHSPREPCVGSKEDLEGKQSGEGLRGHRVAALPHAAPQGPGTSHTQPGTGTVLHRQFFTPNAKGADPDSAALGPHAFPAAHFSPAKAGSCLPEFTASLLLRISNIIPLENPTTASGRMKEATMYNKLDPLVPIP